MFGLLVGTNFKSLNGYLVQDRDNVTDSKDILTTATDKAPNESEIEDQNNSVNKKKQEKKKEIFADSIKKIDDLRNLIKNVDKDLNDFAKEIKNKQKNRNDYERQLFNIFKNINKIHLDEINLVRKEKKKRKGNSNSGFNKEVLVPEILANFLNLPSETCMSRPKVMSALNNKFTELNLKNGQNTQLNAEVVKELQLGPEYENKIIKFTEFQAFLASFYNK